MKINHNRQRRIAMYQTRVMNSRFRACNFQRKLVAARRNGFSLVDDSRNEERGAQPVAIRGELTRVFSVRVVYNL